MIKVLYSMDQTVLLWLQDVVRCPALSFFLVPLTLLGEAGILWILISGVMLFFPKTRKIGCLSLLSLLVCYLVNDKVFKVLVERPRPFLVMPTLKTLISWPMSWSFPSGHACSSFSAATMYSYGGEKRWLKSLFWVLAAAMAFSRMYVGVHYPTDVLAGMLIGTSGSILLWHLLQHRYDLIEARVTERKRTA